MELDSQRLEREGEEVRYRQTETQGDMTERVFFAHQVDDYREGILCA